MKVLVINTGAGADLYLYDTDGTKKHLGRAMVSTSLKDVAKMAIKQIKKYSPDIMVADSKAMNSILKEEYEKHKNSEDNKIVRLAAYIVREFPEVDEEDPIEAAIKIMSDAKNKRSHTVVLNIENISSDDIIKITEGASGSLVTSEK